LIVAGAVAGAYLATLEARRRDQNPDHVWNALLVALIFGVIGARVYHIISTLSDPNQTQLAQQYLSNPLTMLNPRGGGLGIFGAIAGGMFGIWIYTRYAHLKFWQWVDIAMPGLAVGQAIGRWGNYFNQELYGYPTDLPWGIPISAAHRLPQFAALPESTRFHPTFLYESLAMVLVTIFLMVVGRRYAARLLDGDMFLLYGIAYSIVRFFIEMQRPDAWKISDIPTAQLISIAGFVICTVWLAYRHTGTGARQRKSERATRRRAQRQAARVNADKPTP
jgi:phosphatidylglycerol:prolipoprotein diacylglycerol transferase